MPSHRSAGASRDGGGGGGGAPPPPFRVLHQKVVLRVDGEQCLVTGFTDLTLECLEDFRQLRLHCRQMRVLMVRADGVPTRFDLSDPLLRVIGVKCRPGVGETLVVWVRRYKLGVICVNESWNYIACDIFNIINYELIRL